MIVCMHVCIYTMYVCVCACVWTLKLLAILGEQFIVGNEICGAVISIRSNEDIISLWNRTASDTAVTGRIRYTAIFFRAIQLLIVIQGDYGCLINTHFPLSLRDTMTRVMSLPLNTVIEYKTHNTSLK